MATFWRSVVRDLLAIEEDAASHHGLLVHPPISAKTQHHILIMRVPYLGSIRISR